MSFITCSHVSAVNATLRCAFVRNNSDCQDVDGLINYIDFVYCDFRYVYVPLIVCILWLIVLFVALGSTADDYFCPCLEVIAKVLKLPDNVAGVTFLAFGNGAPDIFSSIAGVQQMRPELVISALFGAGVFVTSVVVGIIILIHPFEMAQRPFLRDVIFYLGAAFWTFYLFYKGSITLYHSIGFIFLYILYIVTVLMSHFIYQKYMKPPNAMRAALAQVPKLVVTAVSSPGMVNEAAVDIDYLTDDSLIPWGAPPYARRRR